MSSPSLQHPDHVPAAESPTIAIHAGQRAPVRSAAPHDDPTELLPMASDGGTRVIQPRQVVSEPQTVLVRPRSEAQPIRRPRERVVQSTPQVSQVSQVPQVPPSSERHGQPDGTEPAPPIADAPRVGSVLDGRWRLTRLLGQGGMGQVWLGADLRLPTRTAAVKTMHTRFVEDPSFRERFAREQTIMATVDDCPHIPALLDASAEDAPTPYYAMQVIRGATLRQITQLGHGKPVLSPHDTCTVMVELLEGLCGIHRHGIIHRDLKPGNLIITPDGRLIITDFGIAKPTDPEADQVTRFGQAVGSNDYASPNSAAANRSTSAVTCTPRASSGARCWSADCNNSSHSPNRRSPHRLRRNPNSGRANRGTRLRPAASRCPHGSRPCARRPCVLIPISAHPPRSCWNGCVRGCCTTPRRRRVRRHSLRRTAQRSPTPRPSIHHAPTTTSTPCGCLATCISAAATVWRGTWPPRDGGMRGRLRRVISRRCTTLVA
ncbi:protein kinase [Bifidobacterium pullorum subsp. saeculare]|nr:protein kinase [Bifidobacterium pullorum subsp. saeculare]